MKLLDRLYRDLTPDAVFLAAGWATLSIVARHRPPLVILASLVVALALRALVIDVVDRVKVRRARRRVLG